jgi:6,7-dimethyl-8-ribityllumazine synthase
LGEGEGQLHGAHDGSALRIAVVCSRFNEDVTKRLLDGASEALARLGVSEENKVVAWVPGAFELPLAARHLALSRRHDAIVCLGAVVRGETAHYELVARECARGLQEVQIRTGIPVTFGVLATENLDQALERSGGSLGNKGDEAVVTAVEMANLITLVTE